MATADLKSRLWSCASLEEAVGGMALPDDPQELAEVIKERRYPWLPWLLF